jgi:uncharacterized damage-inducible protein DinB
MEARPHRDRLLYELNEIRKELIAEVHRLKPEEYDWAPRPDMKSCRALLQEIGTMEKICVHYLERLEMLDWNEVAGTLAPPGGDATAALAGLEQVRLQTVSYLNDSSEERLQTPVSLPESWHQYFDSPAIEPEEMLRWVARHEYYHLGQFITYRWILGDNPYKRS